MQSNRGQHIYYGLIIFALGINCSLILGIDWFLAFVIGDMCVTVAAVTKEFTDRQHGSSFDWLDVVATTLLPYSFTLILLIIELVWLR